MYLLYNVKCSAENSKKNISECWYTENLISNFRCTTLESDDYYYNNSINGRWYKIYKTKEEVNVFNRK